MSSEYSSDSDFDYTIKKCNLDDSEQILKLLKNSNVYDDILSVSNIISENSFCAKSDDFLLCFISILEFEQISKFLHKNIKKKIRKFFKTKYKFLFYEKICNTPYKIVLDLVKKIIKNDSKKFIFLSRCEISKNLPELSISFEEYKSEDLKYFPVKEEEVFYFNNCKESFVFEFQDNFYRLNVINKKNLKKFMQLLENDIK